MNIFGSCQCGNIKYEVDDEYLALGFCYCTECQKMSTGIGTYSMIIRRDSFKLLSGTLKQWERSSDIGNRNIAHFCPICSNRIYHENPEANDIIRVKAGTIDNANKLKPEIHVWVRSAPSWVKFPEGAITYETQPTAEEVVKKMAELRGKQNL